MKNTITFFILLAVVLIGGYFAVTYYFSDKEGQNNQNPVGATPIEEISFEFPESLGTSYVASIDWPPQLQVVDETYNCIEAGNEIDRAGRTEERVINGNQYCVTIVSEGSAGSLYRQYAYAFAYHDQTAYLTFSLRYPQCRNYEDGAQNECEDEQSRFDIDTLIDDVVTTGLAVEG